MLIPIAVLTLLQRQSLSDEGLAPAKRVPPKSTWHQVVTKVGLTVSVPVDLIQTSLQGTDVKHPSGACYSAKNWPGCSLQARKADFAKEDLDDSVAVRLEDVVYNEIDLGEDSVSSVNFGLLRGWPKVTVQGTRKDGTQFCYSAVRTKSLNYLIGVYGSSLPAPADVKRVMDSVVLPKSAGIGKVKDWIPSAATASLLNGAVGVWSPFRLKQSDDPVDLGDDSFKGVEYDGEFGYSTYEVVVLSIPDSMTDSLDDDGIEQAARAMLDADADGDAIKYGEFTTVTATSATFRSAKMDEDTLQGRIEYVRIKDKVVLFVAFVPRGMLDSDPVQRFFSSIRVKK